jgi:HK97 family phage portal protein
VLDLLLGPASRYATIGPVVDAERPSNWLRDFVGGGTTKAGVPVNQQTALTFAAVFCATRVLCEPAGFLPLETYERVTDDDRRKATDYLLYDILKNAPNDSMAAEPFWEGRTQHCINWGGGFAEIERESDDPNSQCVALHPIHPSRVWASSRDQAAGGFIYNVRNDDNSAVAMRAHEMLHIPGVLTDDGIWGKGIIQYARETIGGGLAKQKHGAQFFASGGQPKGIIKNFASYNNKEARQSFRADWRDIHSAGPTELALMPPGSEYVPIGIPNEASQFIESSGFDIKDVSRFYRVPLHMIGDLEKANYNSIELMSLEFVIYSLWPWLRRIQGQCNLKLIPRMDRSRYYTEHNLSALLRGDLKTRMDSYRLAISIGIMTINEVRRLENMPGIGPEGDVHYVPMNMTTTERMMLGIGTGTNPPGNGSDQSGTQGVEALTQEQSSRVDTLLKTFEQDVAHGNGHDNTAALDPTRRAARAVLRDTLGRMFTKESNAAKRAAPREDFETWSEDFYGKHRATLTEALRPATQLLAVLGIHETAETLSARLIGDSKNRISAALSASPATLMASLDSWPTQRAEATADEILNGI